MFEIINKWVHVASLQSRLWSQKHVKAPRRNLIFTAENLCKIGWGESGLNDP